ncbi:hypothetical protein GCM10022221_11310 [Actinocorallia aurea]
MFARLGQAGLAALLVASGVVAAPLAASAAAGKCALGTWTVTKHTFRFSGAGFSSRGGGGKGAKLTVKAKSLKYDFANAARLTATVEESGGQTTDTWARYSKTLTLSGVFKGGKKGTFAVERKTAKGPATVKAWEVGDPDPVETYNLASSLKFGGLEPLVPVKGAFTCSKRALHQSLSQKSGGVTVRMDVWFRR